MKKKHYLLAGLFVFVAIAWFLVEQGGTMQAADPPVIYIGTDNKTNEVYEVRNSELEITVHNADGTLKEIKKISAVKSNSGSTIVSFSEKDSTHYMMKAESAGETTISITYTDENGDDKQLNRDIKVPYAFNEDSRYFNKIYTTDKNNAMILKYGTKGKLSFLFPVGDLAWSSGNSQVITVDKDGSFRTVGTGKTKISASYNVGTKVETTTVDVYVGPCITDGNASNPDTPNLKFSAHIKSTVITGAENSGTLQELLTNKIGWITSKIEGSNAVRIDEEIFEHAPYDTSLTVKGHAGKYSVLFYTAGINPESADLSDFVKDRLMQTLTLDIYAECKDQKISLQVNDTYNIAEVFNMTEADFKNYFTVTCSGDICESVTDADGSTCTIKGKGEGNTVVTVTVKDIGKLADLNSKIPMDGITITESTVFKIDVTVYKGFSLSITKTTLTIGETKQLEPVYMGNQGNVKWESSDKSVVTVDNSGMIKGVSSSKGKYVTITASMTLSDGRTLKAICLVLVTETATKITLDPNERTIEVGQAVTIKAKFTPDNVSTADLSWSLTDSTVADMSVGTDGKSVVITGLKAGETLVTVVNKDNAVVSYAKIKIAAPIEKIQLNKTEMTVRKSAEEVKLIAKYFPTDATLNELLWQSSDSTVATVDDYGVVTLVGPGTVTIRVTPKTNPNFVEATCRITVVAAAEQFSLNKKAITLEVGNKEKLETAVTPNNATVDITWKSLNSKVAMVSNDGVVTAVAAGQAYIVANTENGFVDNCLVTVTQKASGVKLSDYNVTVNVGESYTVTATPNPTTSTETKFTWTSKEPSIATVKDGTVTGVSAGSTIILVKTKSGDVAYLYVTVKDKAKGMELNYSTKSVAKGSSFTLKPIFTPTNTSNKNVTWTSSNTGVATVSEKGKVTGVKGGSAIITAVSEDGGYVATCLVTVVQPVSSVKLNHTTYKLGLGKSVTLKATVTSNTSSNPKVKWTSSNTKIATVSSTGKVTAKKLGSCTITAKVTDGTGKKATCKITVVREATSIKLNRSYLTLVTGKNYRLKTTIKPTNATYKTAKWSSSDTAIARVDSTGLVRGLSVGSCSIKASAKDNSKKSASCYVEVIEPIPSTSVIVADKNMVMIRGESQMLSYSIVPSNSTDSIKFASGNKNIATVSSSGKVYARRAGATSITITTSSGKQTVIQLQVIGLNKTSLTLEQYDTETLYVDGVTTGVSWYSANPSIATVVNGKVVGRKKGTTTIYAKVSGITLGCKVTVKNIS